MIRRLAPLTLLLLAACHSHQAPGSAGPSHVADVPIEAEEHFLVCQVGERDIGQIVSRCVLTPVDAPALAATIERWGHARGTWNDQLFETSSFAGRYAMTADERGCLKAAFCREMERD